MRITITAAQLEAASACEEGVVAFRALYGESTVQEWTREVQIETLKGPLGKYVGWAYANGLLPLWSMARANLSRANLYGASLYGASLYGANLSRANLSRANLDRANLDGANLDGANLDGASLDRASLDRANLDGAKVCLCGSPPCVAMRGVLASAGWTPSPDGLLSRVAPVASS